MKLKIYRGMFYIELYVASDMSIAIEEHFDSKIIRYFQDGKDIILFPNIPPQ